MSDAEPAMSNRADSPNFDRSGGGATDGGAVALAGHP